MINFLSSWVKNFALALIIVSILEMLLPNNKTKKYVKMVMGLYILFSLISPFIENSDKFNLDDSMYTKYVKEYSSIDTTVDQSSMDIRLNEIYKEQIEKDIVQKMEKKGYEVEKCKVIAHISEEDSGIENITLKIKSKTGVEENEDINKKNSGTENDEQKTDTVENKIVTEIQKIQKVEIGVYKNDQKDAIDQENTSQRTNLTKTDIKVIKEFLINEYGVSEQCLKIS